jgi:hypothetical protein
VVAEERSKMGDRLFYLVFSNPVEGREDEFNEWYDTVHVPEVLAVPGMISAQRAAFLETETGKAGGLSPDVHRFCVVYEMDGDPDEVMTEIRRRIEIGEMSMNDCIDMTSVQMHWWTQQGPKQMAPSS